MYQIHMFHMTTHDYIRLHMNVEAVFVITRLSIYYKEKSIGLMWMCDFMTSDRQKTI